MSDNSGAKDHNDTAVSSQDMCWDGTAMDEVPVVAGALFGGGLRGMEANTNESKGTPTAVSGMGSGSIHDFGTVTNGQLDESC